MAMHVYTVWHYYAGEQRAGAIEAWRTTSFGEARDVCIDYLARLLILIAAQPQLVGVAHTVAIEEDSGRLVREYIYDGETSNDFVLVTSNEPGEGLQRAI